jgi:pyruvate kinase
MANELRANAIVSLIRSGSMTRYLSWLRPRYSTIYAIGQNQDVAEELTLHWGVVPLVMPFDPHNLDKNIEAALELLHQKKLLRKGNTVVVVSSIQAGEQIVDAVQMRVV